MGLRVSARRRLFLAIAGLGTSFLCGLFATGAMGSAASPPKVTITSPQEGAVFTDATVNVKGKFTVATYDGPSPRVSATLNGKPIDTSVDGPTSYQFQGKATLAKGLNKLTVLVNDGNGGETEASVTVKYAPLLPTSHQCVSDKRGDSHDHFTHMDIVRACARRSGGKVVFSVTTAKPPPNIHDGFGNPAAPCIEIPRVPGGGPGPAPLQTCGDAKLRGYTQHFWPSVPFNISGSTSTWKIPLKYLPAKQFKWRAYISDADHYRDKAPDKGFLTFVVK